LVSSKSNSQSRSSAMQQLCDACYNIRHDWLAPKVTANHVRVLRNNCAQQLRNVLLNTRRDWLAPKVIANHVRVLHNCCACCAANELIDFLTYLLMNRSILLCRIFMRCTSLPEEILRNENDTHAHCALVNIYNFNCLSQKADPMQ